MSVFWSAFVHNNFLFACICLLNSELLIFIVLFATSQKSSYAHEWFFKECPERGANMGSFWFSFIFSLTSSTLEHSPTVSPISVNLYQVYFVALKTERLIGLKTSRELSSWRRLVRENKQKILSFPPPEQSWEKYSFISCTNRMNK